MDLGEPRAKCLSDRPEHREMSVHSGNLVCVRCFLEKVRKVVRVHRKSSKIL
jgi:hypothetical protein